MHVLMRVLNRTTAAALLVATCLAARPALAQKYGGVLQGVLLANPGSLSIPEELFFTVVPLTPMFNNLVVFDPLNSRASLDSVRPELAESWSWSADRKSLVFRLRQGVKFHDGQPLTSKDAKHTFDLGRGKGEPKLRISPRKDWFSNVEEIATDGDREVIFRLRRPQPSLVAMLATGYAAVYPAHIPVADWRTKAIGTGPFTLKEYKRDQYLVLEKNPEYWVPGRPYMNGIRYTVIRARPTRLAAFQAGHADLNFPLETPRPFMAALKQAAPNLKFAESPRLTFPAVFANPKVKPWDDRRMWQVLNLAIDREAFVKTVFQGGAVVGGANLPPPGGAWGLPKDRLMAIPGYAPDPDRKEKARQIMAALGYAADHPLKTKLVVRGDTQFNVDSAVWVVSQLKEVWIDAELTPKETATFFATLARREFALGVHSSGSATDDPDVTFYEHYACRSPRNYSDYCVEEMQKLYATQSEMFDPAQRMELVQSIDERLMRDVARVILGYLVDYNAMQSYVMNLVPHQGGYSYMRLQEVWLDK
ncbi:MAG: ABC transporter substrate-binding protein [Candidatus Lambdaproteobacteria bacterium]|nr:ABC transporter substrate-binding protein [Candidatus Lambdaproteobacteria bacterium]